MLLFASRPTIASSSATILLVFVRPSSLPASAWAFRRTGLTPESSTICKHRYPAEVLRSSAKITRGCWTHDGCEPPTVPSPPITPPPPQIPDNGDDEPVSPVPTPPQSNTPAPQEPTLPEGPEEGEEIPVPTRPNTPEPPEPTVPDDTDEDGDVYVTPISTPPQSTTPEPEEPSVPEDTTCGPLPSVTTSSGAQYDSFYCGVGQDFNSDQVQEYGSTLFVDVEELDDNLAITGCADMAESAGYSSFNVRHHPGGWYCTPFQWPGVSGVDWKFAEPTVGSSYAYQVASTRPARGGRGGTVIQRARLRHR